MPWKSEELPLPSGASSSTLASSTFTCAQGRTHERNGGIMCRSVAPVYLTPSGLGHGFGETVPHPAPSAGSARPSAARLSAGNVNRHAPE
ncbi:MAG: hypothetical protein BJ554DRAFT_565 [Olpidium bornovanus]|uniref:Uncharacterized protein n=1 Tax=Olpidium bornovanus TaxID=278681 RepID=A0A8H7ZTI1_9FUNG|nr:MAG: hypothetical protein BJ554DRAFT_565 [Olpidium bornovanus]